MGLFDKFKKLVSNEKAIEKNTQEKIQEETKNEIKNDIDKKDYAHLTKGTSLEGVDLEELPPAFRQMTKDVLDKREQQSKKPQINLDNIYPRLKNGQIEKAESMEAEVMIDGKMQDIVLPKSSLLFGIDLGSDFSCCFAYDKETIYDLLTNTKFEDLNITKQDLYKKACENFLRDYGNKIEAHPTNFPGVRMMRIDGNMEACTFLIAGIWTNTKDNLKLNKIFAMAPLQDIVLFWDELEEGVMEQMISQIEDLVQNQPTSRRVSSHIYEFKDNGFKETGTSLNFNPQS